MENTESGLAVQQLLKMKAKGQISLAQFLELTKEVAGTTDELPIIISKIKVGCSSLEPT